MIFVISGMSRRLAPLDSGRRRNDGWGGRNDGDCPRRTLRGAKGVVAVGVGVVAPGDFAEVVEDAVDTAGGFLELLSGVSGEDWVDGACLSIRLHEH